MDSGTDPMTMEGPIACVIRVDGRLDPYWTARLGGLRLAASGTSGVPWGELRGVLPDQAALRAGH